MLLFAISMFFMMFAGRLVAPIFINLEDIEHLQENFAAMELF